jgi:xylulokinase
MASEELCLCIDLGTGGPKVAFVTLDGVILNSALHHVPTHFGDDGAATQDAELWWTLIKQSVVELATSNDVDVTHLRAVAITGQYASTVPVDELGQPTSECLTWLDTRGKNHSRRAVGGWLQGYNPRKLWPFIRRTGGAPSTSGADPIGQILFLKNERPEVWARTRWLMEPIDYLAMRFCSVASATHASRLAMWVTDNRRLTDLHYDEKLLASVGLSSEKLPPLTSALSLLGTVSPDVAHELGLPLDVVVIAPMPDLHAAAFGSGASAPHKAHLALSTTSWISCRVPRKKTDVMHSIAAVPGLDNASYVVIDNQETGAKALEWFQGILAHGESTMSFDDMTALAATSPPGANGVVFTPWLAGERSPIDDKHVRAGFRNLSLTTTTADMIRAVLEGVGANSAWLLGYVEKFVGQKLEPLRLIGGGAQSDLWCQIFADTLGREVHQITNPMTVQLRGTAMAASVALGLRTIDQCDEISPSASVFRPDPALREFYQQRVRDHASLYKRDHSWATRHRR